jgi:phage N-6-adenine-methyltransferase
VKKSQYLIESSTNEWYTPHHIVASVKAVFDGVIGLDPYSCDAAQAIVGADHYFTKEEDAFLSDWPVVTKVFANPPYERKVIDRCITQLIEYQRRFTTVRDFEMIVLVNAATEVGWFFTLLTNCDAVCFTRGRLEYIRGANQGKAGNPRGQALFYFGNDPERFGEIFSQHGYIFVQ